MSKSVLRPVLCRTGTASFFPTTSLVVLSVLYIEIYLILAWEGAIFIVGFKEKGSKAGGVGNQKVLRGRMDSGP